MDIEAVKVSYKIGKMLKKLVPEVVFDLYHVNIIIHNSVPVTLAEFSKKVAEFSKPTMALFAKITDANFKQSDVDGEWKTKNCPNTSLGSFYYWGVYSRVVSPCWSDVRVNRAIKPAYLRAH